MKRELKTWETICDYCKTIIVTQSSYYKLPDGWVVVEAHDCGLTGYTNYNDMCPTCQQKDQ